MWRDFDAFNRIKEIILPKQNEAEWDLEIPGFVKEDFTVHFVDSYAEMFEIVFGHQIHTILLFDAKIGAESFILPQKNIEEDPLPPSPRLS